MTSIRIKYLNGDSTQRYANVLVNEVVHVVAFLPTASGTPGSSVLTVPLNAGSANKIVFEAYNAGWGKCSCAVTNLEKTELIWNQDLTLTG